MVSEEYHNQCDRSSVAAEMHAELQMWVLPTY
jgi:hypothetical protein